MQKRVIIITQGLSPIVRPIVESEICSVVGIIECAPRLRVKKRLMHIILTSIRNICRKTLYGYARKRKIPYFYMEKSNEILKNWILALAPELIVIYSMSQLLKEEIFTIPVFGTINLHPSLLPKYRGPNPIFWMYYNTDLRPGVTVHYIDKGEDTGDVLLQESFDIPLGIPLQAYNDICIKKIGVKLLFEAIRNIENLQPIKQPIKSPTPRARNLKLEEHTAIIDWERWEIERIWHLLRGTQDWLNVLPLPKGFFIFRACWNVGEYKKCVHTLQMGKIYRKVYGEHYAIACKNGIISLYKQYRFIQMIWSVLHKYIH